MPVPTDVKVEIEFAPGSGTWTDVTSDVDFPAGISIKYGRTSEFSQAQTATLSLQLDNKNGQYTPKSHLLADGVTVNPNYPNVKPRRQIRVSYAQLGANVFPAGDFESAGFPATWTVSNCAVTQDLVTFHDGAASMKVTWATAIASGAVAGIAVLNVTPGVPYQLTTWMRAAVGQPRPGFTVSTGDVAEQFSAPVAADGAWHQVTMSFIGGSPGYVAVGPYNVDATTAGNTCNVDTLVVQATRVYRYWGKIKSWPPLMENGYRPNVAITASDKQDALSRGALRSMFEQEVAATSPTAVYLMNDPAPANAITMPTFADSSGNGNSSITQVAWPNASPVNAGAANPMPQSMGLTGAVASFGGAINFARLITNVQTSTVNFAVGFWVTLPVYGTGSAKIGTSGIQFDYEDVFGGTGTTTDLEMVINYGVGTNAVLAVMAVGSPLTGLGSVINGSVAADGAPHHYFLSVLTNGGTQTTSLYIDGVLAGSTGYAAGQILAAPKQPTMLMVLDSTDGNKIVTGGLTIYSGTPATVSTLAASLFGGGNGWAGDTTAQRITRYLTYGGLKASEMSIGAGSEIMSGAHNVVGKSVIAACQDVVTTEGGGAAIYSRPQGGQMVFVGRTYRNNAVPALTIDGNLDMDISTPFSPSFDDMNLINTSTVTRQGGLTQTFADTASVTENGLSPDSVATLCSTDSAALNLAQSRVAAQRQPAYRLGQIAVDLVHAANNLYNAIVNVAIGSRLRATVLPVALAAPKTQQDVYVEGWSENITNKSWKIIFDTSPADNPFIAHWNDATARWRTDPKNPPTITLNMLVSHTSFTVIIPVGAQYFNPADVPFDVQLDEEVMTATACTAATGGSQTLTVTRGTQNTRVAPHVINSPVDLYPPTTWAL